MNATHDEHAGAHEMLDGLTLNYVQKTFSDVHAQGSTPALSPRRCKSPLVQGGSGVCGPCWYALMNCSRIPTRHTKPLFTEEPKEGVFSEVRSPLYFIAFVVVPRIRLSCRVVL